MFFQLSPTKVKTVAFSRNFMLTAAEAATEAEGTAAAAAAISQGYRIIVHLEPKCPVCFWSCHCP